MFRLDPDQIFRSTLLEQIPGLQHGFGTRSVHDWLSGKRVASLRQVHSNTVVEAEDCGALGDGDALITCQKDLYVSIRTADCVPILLADSEHGAVAALHAGWRGTVAGIVCSALEKMTLTYDSAPARVIAAIGPAIGLCCFQVGAEVASQFGTFFPEWDNLNQRRNIDLVEANRRQLIQAGVPEYNIDVAGRCTMCDGKLFDSYRREGTAAGRMTSAIMLD